MTTSVHPPAAGTPPVSAAADSRARVAVVPTATMRPPAALAALTTAAVDPDTANRSGCGASPASCDERPVWRVTGTMTMPAETRLVTSWVVKGRAALAISALPGIVPKTVW